MGRRRRRVIRIVKKKLPTVFVCPRCGEEAVRVTIAKDTGHATVLCALCNLKDDFAAHPAAQPIDVYSYFTDRFYGVKDPRPIIPREREIQHILPEEEPAEEIEAPSPSIGEEPRLPETKVEAEKLGAESKVSPAPEVSGGETTPEPNLEPASVEATQQNKDQETRVESSEATAQAEKESEEETEPFADILENKDKKRYSSTPLPPQSTEQTS